MPTLRSRRVTSQPEARRRDSVTTPPNQRSTTQGSIGSSDARMRSATGAAAAPATGPLAPFVAAGEGATAVAVSYSKVHGGSCVKRTAVARGKASIKRSVTVASA